MPLVMPRYFAVAGNVTLSSASLPSYMPGTSSPSAAASREKEARTREVIVVSMCSEWRLTVPLILHDGKSDVVEDNGSALGEW